MSWMDRVCGSRNCGCTSEACPTLSEDEAREYVINVIVHVFVTEDRRLHPHRHILHRHISDFHDHHLRHIARLNGLQRKRPVGLAQSEMSRLILKLQLDNDLYLSPTARAIHEGHALYVPEARSRGSIHHRICNSSDYSFGCDW